MEFGWPDDKQTKNTRQKTGNSSFSDGHALQCEVCKHHAYIKSQFGDLPEPDNNEKPHSYDGGDIQHQAVRGSQTQCQKELLSQVILCVFA